jgi:hypothetical protein
MNGSPGSRYPKNVHSARGGIGMTDWLRIGIVLVVVVVCGYLLWKRQKGKKEDVPPPDDLKEIVVDAEVEEPKVE